MDNKTEIEIDGRGLMDLGAAMAEPRTLDGGAQILVIPDDYKVVEDLEKLLPAPRRAKGNVQFIDAQSFIRYVNKHKDQPGVESNARHGRGSQGGETPAADADDVQTVIYVDPVQQKFKAVFDAHAADAPGWGQFTATYDCPVSPEWQTWKASNGKKMLQEAFAYFIEQNILDVHEPNGAEMLALVTTLKSTKNVAFDSGIRLQDGQVQLKYHEENTTKAGVNGEMKIPEEITLGLPVYVGGEAYAVKAKFRWRIEGAQLSMWYDLIRPHKVEEVAIDKLISQVADGTKIPPYKAKV